MRGKKIIFITFITIFIGCLNSVSAAEIIVDASGNGDYTTIKEAVNAAVQGDTITIKNGNYSESAITVDKIITIQGESMDGVKISLSGFSDLFILQAGATLKKMTLNAFANNAIEIKSNDVILEYITHESDGASSFETDPEITVSNLVIKNCYLHKGLEINGAYNILLENIEIISSWGLDLNATNSNIINCIITGGKVIVNEHCENVKFQGCTFKDRNSACFSMEGDSNKVYNCIFRNISGTFSSALALGGKNNEIKGCTFTNNYEGIFVPNAKNCIIEYNNFIDNNNCGVNGVFGTIDDDGYWVGINIDNNWWGDPTGPYNKTLNPDGKGDNVTGYVTFTKWLDAESTWTPGSDDNTDNTITGDNGSEDDNGIPGFELVAFLTAIAFIIYFRRRKNT